MWHFITDDLVIAVAFVAHGIANYLFFWLPLALILWGATKLYGRFRK